MVAKEISYSVVKRSGTLVPFRKERIIKALEAAFRDTKKVPFPTPLDSELEAIISKIADLVVKQVLHLAAKGASLTVEGIQDVVEVTLMKNGHCDVARDYIVYRNSRKATRQENSLLKIYRRNKTTPTLFNPIRIASSIEKAFRRAKKIEDQMSDEVIAAVNQIAQKIVADVKSLTANGELLYIDAVEEKIEEALMIEKHFDVARDYILYRAEKIKARISLDTKEKEGKPSRSFEVETSDGKFLITDAMLRGRIAYACKNLEDVVSIEELLDTAITQFYSGMKDHEVDLALIFAAKAKIEKEPTYSQVASRLLIDLLYRETVGLSASETKFAKAHAEYFPKYIREGIALERISPTLLDFDLEELAAAMDLQRDDLFSYLGLQTLYDRYFIHNMQRRLETPQIFWMRVAMGLSINEKEKTKRAIEFYNLFSQFYFTSSTPTLFNSGTLHSQLSSCYLSTVMDDLHHIFKVIADDAQLSKWAGGLGNDWTYVRATGARIKGTNGTSQGVIPFLKVANDTAVAVNQGGKRKGAMCAYLETWHLDIEDFLELRKNTGDERRRTHDMNTANWIPDLFMKRVREGGMWTLFTPSDVPDLHDLYGAAFEKRFEEYEKQVDEGKIKLFKRVEALQLWRKMLSMLFETGHPWITFKDPSNIRSAQDHVGVVHSSNLCTEILLNTSKEETAVCNLGSINLARHMTPEGLDEKQVAATIRTAIRMLDNVIDINFYPTVEAKTANLRHRPIGLGIMGFQDALYLLNVSYASHEAVAFADKSMEMISYYAILASTELAEEKGTYSTYKGSKWDRGFLPIDTIALLDKERGIPIDIDRSSTMNWEKVRDEVRKHGMRNSHTMAIAPTATIANITGVIPSNEPIYKHLFVKSNLSGEFTIINPYLVEKLKEHSLWDEEMIDDLKYFDGTIRDIERIPDSLKQLFLTAFEVEPEWIIECAARRQKWIDMGQSLNLYLAEPSGKKLHQMYLLAWEKGLKTTYYLRSLGATQIEKSTVDINKRGLQPRWMKSKSASSNVSIVREEKKVACSLGEGCESCQ
ncbi:MAG: ribonucleoside-diphosphate reductase subunit alpha [Verrucomicrobia bacterium RIFCSPHIGHO2_12_FULL_41_10]|nr:MAG: ribonucleoside-diphosphate reductase subunit alpha [Verrucomicrobia bacterium RIFCSPHIGHO2_12_FULL_41_10]